MNSEDELDRSKRLIKFNDLLPYADQLEDEAQEIFAEIKSAIASCLSAAEVRPGLVNWIFHLQRFINLYGYRFSRKEHIELVQLFLEIILLPDLDLGSVPVLAATISLLLSPPEDSSKLKKVASLATSRKKYLLSPDDLTIEWRPLFRLTERCARDNTEFYGLVHHTQELENQINALIRACRPYFPVTATQEMLDEWLVDICPTDIERDQIFRNFRNFLPTTLPPEHFDKGWKLWFDRFISIWLLDRRSHTRQFHLGGLFARLAEDNVGYIDWEPYLPHVFTRLLRSFNLPYKSEYFRPSRVLPTPCETHQLTRWIVAALGGGSSAQKYLEQLLKTVESFFHPSNLGKWSTKLSKFLGKLADGFFERLYIERYKEPSWQNQTPESKKLSEDDIDAFVDSVLPIILMTIFSKLNALFGSKALLALAAIRPAKVVPPLMEKLNDALFNVTEPHRLISTLNSLEIATRPLVLNHFSLRTSVDVPSLLMGCLPGIDPNDTHKTSVTFRLISTLVTVIPLVDCTAIADEVAPELQQICLATGVFEEFVLELLTRCFVVTESITADMNHQRENMSSIENEITSSGMQMTFLVVFRQCPPALYRSAVEKLYSFFNSRILDPVAGKMISAIVRCAVAANPVYGLEKFFPHFSKLALTLMAPDEVLKDEKVDNELLFSLILLGDVVGGANAEALHPYAPTLIRVIQRGLKLTAKAGISAVCEIIQNAFRTLVSLYAMPFGELINPTKLDASDPPILHWGESSDLRTMKIDWHVASDADLAVARSIFESCVEPELETLNQWCLDSQANPLTKENLHKSLLVVLRSLQGLGSSLPPLKGELMNVTGCKTPLRSKIMYHLGQKCFDEDLRLNILDLMERVVNTIFDVCEDNIQSLKTVSHTISLIVFFHGVTRREYDITLRGHKIHSMRLDNPLCIEELRYIRHVIIDRTLMQHKLRLHQLRPQFTSNHARAMNILFRMSISRYSLVRSTAQESLNQFFCQHPRSYNILVDDICSLLSNPNISHDQYKGILYILLGYTDYRMFPINNWEATQKMWPALIQAPHSEKPSIITLLTRLQDQLIQYMDTYPMVTRVPVGIIEKAKEFSGEPFEAAEFPEDCVENGLLNKDFYNDLVAKLTELINSGSLHWRHHFFALVMIKMLLRDDIHYEAETVKMLSNHLISENLRTRKICIDILASVLYQQKRKMKKIKIPRERLEEINESIPLSPILEKCLEDGSPRPFNTFLQFNSANYPDTQEKWDNAIFVHKPSIGYSGFKQELEVYAPDSEQPELARPGNMNAVEQVIYDCFASSEYVTRLVEYLALEENKGKDKFDAKRSALFKMLFRNYGNLFVENFAPSLDRFIKRSKHESEQRCALEIISGMIRGAKHWNFQMNQELSQFVVPLLEAGTSNILQETVMDWGICVATCLESRDCNKYYWFYELISRGNFDGTPFDQTCKMFNLYSGVNSMMWRTMELAHRLLEEITQNLAHPYLNVREHIGLLLTYVFTCDIRENDGQMSPFDIPDNFVFVPKSIEFLGALKQRLAAIKDETLEQEKEDSQRLFQTLLKWQYSDCARNSQPKEALALLPTTFRLFTDTLDEQLQKDCCSLFSKIGYGMHSVPILQAIMDQVRQHLDEYFWRVRDVAISLFRFVTFTNVFTISSNEKLADDVKEICLRALHDERVEVRTTAQGTLSGLIHCGLIEITRELLTDVKNNLRRISNQTRARRREAMEISRNHTTGITTNGQVDKKDKGLSEEQKGWIDYHAAILLLCAYIDANPYDVPTFMPEVICVLADHLHAPQPISSTIKNTLSEFKRTHYDNWRDHRMKFTDEQLTTITDLLVSPSYYA